MFPSVKIKLMCGCQELLYYWEGNQQEEVLNFTTNQINQGIPAGGEDKIKIRITVRACPDCCDKTDFCFMGKGGRCYDIQRRVRAVMGTGSRIVFRRLLSSGLVTEKLLKHYGLQITASCWKNMK